MNLVDPDGRLPILPIIWGIYEFGSAIYDIYNAFDVLSNEESTTGDKLFTAGSLAMSAILPGGGYTSLNKVDNIIEFADDAVDAAKVANKADGAVDAGKAATKIERLHEKAKIGQEAHRQIEAELNNTFGAKPEQKIEIGDNWVRKDAVMKDGTLVIIKPNTPTGHKAAQKREELMHKYGHKTQTIFYNPNNPRYLPGSSTYIGPHKNK